MTFETFISLLVLAAITTWTPGPNNAMVASSGANFGVRRTAPHIFGIAFGFPFMIFIVGQFLGQLFQTSELIRTTVNGLGAVIMLWLAWKIATAGGITTGKGEPRPLRFIEAAAFQWVNPKAWLMSIAVTSQFVTAENAVRVIPVISAVYIVVALAGTTSWAAFGTAMRRWLKTPGRLVWFNRAMGLLLAGCVVLILLQ